MLRISPSLRIALFYAAFASFWIYFSDQLIHYIYPTAEQATFFQTLKGLLFVFVTAAFLYAYLKKIMKQLREENESRKKAENVLRSERNLLQRITDTSPTAITVVDKEGKITYANRFAEEMFGLSRNEITMRTYNHPSWEITDLNGDPFPEENLPFNRVQKEKKPFFDIQHTFRLQNNKKIVLSINAAPLFDDYGNFEAMVAAMIDITDRKRFETKLKASEERYRILFDKNPLPMWLYDTETLRFLNVNNAAVEKYGYSKNEFLSLTLKDIRPENDVEKFLENVEVSKNEIQRSGIWRHKTKTGKIIFVEISSHAIEIDNKRARIVLANDVTEKIKAEEEREKISERLNYYLSTSPTVIFSLAAKDNVITPLWVSESVQSVLGYTQLEALKPGWWIEHLYPGDREKAVENNKMLLQKGSMFHEYRFYKKDKTLIWVHDELRLLKDDKGNPKEIVGAWTDVTRLKNTEIELRKNENKFRSIFENIQDVYFETSIDGCILEVSPSIFIVSKGKYRREDLIGENMHNFYHHKAERQEFIKQLKKSERLTDFEVSLKLPDNEVIPCSMTAKLIYNENREPKIVGTLRDISHRKNIENALIKAKEIAEKADRLKSEFLAQMSHEIRTPINVILNATDIIESELKDYADEDLKEMFPVTKSAGARIMRTIDSILNMSEIQTGTYQANFKNYDVYKDIIIGLIKEFKPYVKAKSLELICNVYTEKTTVHVDEYSVSKIFSNLIDNAVKYTKHGKIEINIKETEVGELAVEVRDTGIGIKKEFIPRLFDSFTQEETGYTRKFEGNGLGLALVKSYCEVNNARIEVESEVNKGSVFRVIFSKNT